MRSLHASEGQRHAPPAEARPFRAPPVAATVSNQHARLCAEEAPPRCRTIEPPQPSVGAVTSKGTVGPSPAAVRSDNVSPHGFRDVVFPASSLQYPPCRLHAYFYSHVHTCQTHTCPSALPVILSIPVTRAISSRQGAHSRAARISGSVSKRFNPFPVMARPVYAPYLALRILFSAFTSFKFAYANDALSDLFWTGI